MSSLRVAVALVLLGLLQAAQPGVPKAPVWVKGLGLGVVRDSAIYASPSLQGKVLRKAHKREMLTSLGPAKDGWFKVYWEHNTRAYVPLADVEKLWPRDGKGRLVSAWIGYHDVSTDFYTYEIQNPESPDQGESVPLRVAHFFDPTKHVGVDEITRMGPLAMFHVLLKLDDKAFDRWPKKEAVANHRKAIGLLASYGPLALPGILYLLNADGTQHQVHAAETVEVVAIRLAQAETGDSRIISTWCPGMGGLGELAAPGMYYAGEAPEVRGIPANLQTVEQMRSYIVKNPTVAKKVYAALRRFYAIGRSPELVDRMKALLKDKRPEVRQAAAKALKPLGIK